MKTKFFWQTKKPWKPVTFMTIGITEASREAQDAMGQGYKAVIFSIFCFGFIFKWAEWSDLE